MSDAWKAYRGAPEPGTPICPEDAVADGRAVCLDLDGFPLLLARQCGEAFAYVNACPHQYLPLNHRGENLLSADGTLLRCTNHDAAFAVTTGEGIEGFGIGGCLDPVPIVARDGTLFVGDGHALQ